VKDLSVRVHGPLGRQQVELLRLQLTEWLGALGASRPDAYAAMSVLDEFASNLMEYSGANWAELQAWPKDGRIHVCLRDDGKRFDPTTLMRKDYTEYLKGEPDRKLGLYMVSKLTDDVKYQREEPEGVNCLSFRLKFKSWVAPGGPEGNKN
jgi:anti-sigma regulatory factor (Ser/Thr protein kinase)